MLDADTHMEIAYRRLEELGLEATAQGITLLNNWAVVNHRAGDVRRAEQLAERALALAGPGERSAFLLMNRARALELREGLPRRRPAFARPSGPRRTRSRCPRWWAPRPARHPS